MLRIECKIELHEGLNRGKFLHLAIVELIGAGIGWTYSWHASLVGIALFRVSSSAFRRSRSASIFLNCASDMLCVCSLGKASELKSHKQVKVAASLWGETPNALCQFLNNKGRAKLYRAGKEI